MKRTTVYLILFMINGTSSPLSAQEPDKEADLQTLYQQIDEAIEQSPQYVAKRLRQIADTRKALLSESNLEKKFVQAEHLFSLLVIYVKAYAPTFTDNYTETAVLPQYISAKP